MNAFVSETPVDAVRERARETLRPLEFLPGARLPALDVRPLPASAPPPRRFTCTHAPRDTSIAFPGPTPPSCPGPGPPT
jgi:hypothetical protein